MDTSSFFCVDLEIFADGDAWELVAPGWVVQSNPDIDFRDEPQTFPTRIADNPRFLTRRTLRPKIPPTRPPKPTDILTTNIPEDILTIGQQLLLTSHDTSFLLRPELASQTLFIPAAFEISHGKDWDAFLLV